MSNLATVVIWSSVRPANAQNLPLFFCTSLLRHSRKIPLENFQPRIHFRVWNWQQLLYIDCFTAALLMAYNGKFYSSRNFNLPNGLRIFPPTRWILCFVCYHIVFYYILCLSKAFRSLKIRSRLKHYTWWTLASCINIMHVMGFVLHKLQFAVYLVNINSLKFLCNLHTI